MSSKQNTIEEVLDSLSHVTDHGHVFDYRVNKKKLKKALEEYVAKQVAAAQVKLADKLDYDGRYNKLGQHDIKTLIVLHNNAIIELSARLEQLAKEKSHLSKKGTES